MSTQTRLEALYAEERALNQDLWDLHVWAPEAHPLCTRLDRVRRQIAMLTEDVRKPTPMPVQRRARP